MLTTTALSNEMVAVWTCRLVEAAVTWDMRLICCLLQYQRIKPLIRQSSPLGEQRLSGHRRTTLLVGAAASTVRTTLRTTCSLQCLLII
jgi:hypothetical protein